MARIWMKRMKNTILHTAQIRFERWWLATNIITSTDVTCLLAKLHFSCQPSLFITNTYFLISPHIGCKSILYFTHCHYAFGRSQPTKWQRIHEDLISHWLQSKLWWVCSAWNAEVWRHAVLCEKLCPKSFGLKLWSNQLLFATMDIASHIISFDSCLLCPSSITIHSHAHTCQPHATRILHINFNQWRRRRWRHWHTHPMCIYWQRQLEWNTRYIQLLFDVLICYF